MNICHISGSKYLSCPSFLELDFCDSPNVVVLKKIRHNLEKEKWVFVKFLKDCECGGEILFVEEYLVFFRWSIKIQG